MTSHIYNDVQVNFQKEIPCLHAYLTVIGAMQYYTSNKIKILKTHEVSNRFELSQHSFGNHSYCYSKYGINALIKKTKQESISRLVHVLCGNFHNH